MQPHYCILPGLIQEVREHLKEMLETDALHRSNSPFSSNVVLIRKKDGTLRFCIYDRKLNQHTRNKSLSHPVHTLHLLAGAIYFAKFDLKSGYWQVQLKEKDKSKTAFYECNC